MASVSIHGSTGVLLVDGQKVFPIGISDPPPSNGRAPSGEHAYQELANGGITMIRSGTPDWAPGKIDQQIARERELQTARRRTACSAGCGSAPSRTCPARPPTSSCCRRS